MTGRSGISERKWTSIKQRLCVREVRSACFPGLCSVLAVMVLAGGVAMFNNYKRLHEMEQVVASVDPEAVIREARGNLSSVAGSRTTGETPVEVIPGDNGTRGSTAGTVEASLTEETPDQTVHRSRQHQNRHRLHRPRQPMQRLLIKYM